jgi:hypothetical protein
MVRGEPVGSLAEEAARLAAVLSAHTGRADAEEPAAHGAGCEWCPLCRARAVVDGLSPEVRQHLTQAATSFALAVQGLLATTTATSGQTDPADDDHRHEE